MTARAIIGWILFVFGTLAIFGVVFLLVLVLTGIFGFGGVGFAVAIILPFAGMIYLVGGGINIWGGWLLAHPAKETKMRKPLGWIMLVFGSLSIICFIVSAIGPYLPFVLRFLTSNFPLEAVIMILGGWWLAHPLKVTGPFSQSEQE